MNLTFSTKVADTGFVTFSAKATGADVPETFLWEVQDGIPAASNDKSATFTFTSIGPKAIRLTAVTKQGCVVMVVKTVKIDKMPG